MIATDPVEESERAPARVTTRSHLRWAGALGVGAVAVLGVLQTVTSAFKPRPIVQVLIVAAVFFAGLWAQRIASRRAARTAAAARATQLREILGVWPPEALPDVDGLRLGVYPRRRDTSADGPYVPRAIDEPLRDALHGGCVALVHGPARSGKSRTALEAISAARPGARVLAPRGRRALAELLALDPPIDLGDVDTIVWLDGLERFAGTMDSLSLEGLMDLTHKSTVVMTVRDSDWTRLLGASGDRGETARAVAAQARAFELPSALTDDERRAAQRTYPGIDFASGIGAGLAARGTESEPAPAHERVTIETVDPVPRGSRDPELVLPLAGAVAALAAFAAVWISSSFSTPTAPSVVSQVNDIRQQFAAKGRKVEHYQINLRGAGADPSQYFRFFDPAGRRDPQSDEVRIYDLDHNSYLRPHFDFKPVGPQAVFRTRATRDVDGDGSRDIVAGLSYACQGGSCPLGGGMLPVVITWDDFHRDYRIVSLDLGRPDVQRSVASEDRTEYTTPVRFADPKHRDYLTGYRVENFGVVRRRNQRLLIGAYLTAVDGTPSYELRGWSFDTRRATPFARPCGRTPHVVSMPLGRQTDYRPAVRARRAPRAAVFRTRIMHGVDADGESRSGRGRLLCVPGFRRERGMSGRRVPMTDDAVDDSDDPGAAGAGVQRGRLDELRASARGWQGIQLAVLGFIGLCGVLQRGDASIPRSIQILAGIAALVALGLACVATYLVGRAAFPLYGARRGDVTEGLAGTKRRLTRGLTLTFVAVALTALAATSSWWPVSSDAASSGLVELSTSQATVCGQLSDNAGAGIGLVIGGRTITVPIDAVTAIHAVDKCP